MDAAHALADLREISSQIEAAVILDADGAVAGSTIDDEERTRRIADAAARLLERAGASGGRPGESLVQLEAATGEGSVLVVREGGRTIVATTAPDPTTGLVVYDLKTCLRSLDEAPAAKPKPKPKAKAKPAAKPKPKAKPRAKAKKAEEADGEA
jgi:predicted regulator of Ras-like GTPase activity (Roadblock/LC7/MglB family)